MSKRTAHCSINLYCVGGDVKHCSINQSIRRSIAVRCWPKSRDCN